MVKKLNLVLLFVINTILCFAQADIFEKEKGQLHNGLIIAANANAEMPFGDLKKRFGTSYRVGPSFLYKTNKNWFIGFKFDFIFGGKVKEDSLMYNIRDANGSFINSNGQRENVGIFERGYATGLLFGKTFSTSKTNPDNGVLFLTGIGFIQHKINIFDKNKSVAALYNDYRKGYDRLTNGWYIEQFLGYNYFHKEGLLNFHLGLNLLVGFTEGRRDFLFDVKRADNAKRLDILFGLRGGWYFPTFRKKSEEVFFE